MIRSNFSPRYPEPPTEETLMQHTLWPETQKLYGHGYEVFSLAASPDQLLLASASHATTAQHAAVLIWYRYYSSNCVQFEFNQSLYEYTYINV